jgi:hypothetical protein
VPKHIKDVKVGCFVYHPSGRDEYGIPRDPYVEHVADVWASVTGAKYSTEYNTNVWRNNPLIVVVFARSKAFTPMPAKHCILYKGELYEVKDVDGLSQKAGMDIKLTCEWRQDIQKLVP